MIQIKKTEWFRLKQEPDDKDFATKIVYTFDNVETHFVDSFKDSEQDSFDSLIEFLMKKTETNKNISYEIIDEELGPLFEIKLGKKWKL